MTTGRINQVSVHNRQPFPSFPERKKKTRKHWTSKPNRVRRRRGLLVLFQVTSKLKKISWILTTFKIKNKKCNCLPLIRHTSLIYKHGQVRFLRFSFLRKKSVISPSLPSSFPSFPGKKIQKSYQESRQHLTEANVARGVNQGTTDNVGTVW